MAQITFKGNPIHTCGTLPAVGSKAPDFNLTGTDLVDVSLQSFAGKRLVLNIFPSVDTGVCAASVRRFNAEAAQLDNTTVLCISLDLPFAHKRFCAAEGLEAVHSVSEMRSRNFGEAYGVRMTDGPLAGLFSRAVMVLDGNGTVLYTQQVPEIVEEPNYADALAALR
ncbi:MAG: thiol peroxidase [Magnetococcales bacterium]|nr:thiol peroxidase [Magnetococcales bacterium]MBF0584244.1 thiol peroxidase [Magnetococcales bacterium]